MIPRDPERRILCLAARTAPDAAARAELPGLLARADEQRLWEEAHRHEVTGLVAATLVRHGGDAVPPGWTSRARRRGLATLVQNRRLRDELLVVLAALGAAGVDASPVKGVALAELLYGDLGLRPTADLDVLVAPAEMPRAREVLAATGYAHEAAPPFEALHHPYHDPQYFRETAGGPVCLELHRGLWSPRFWDEDEGLWERRVGAEIGGRAVRVLSWEDTLVHLAIHRARSPLRLRHLADIAELVRGHGDTMDWDLVVRTARATGSRTAMFMSLDLAGQLLGAPAPREVLTALHVGAAKRRVLARTCGPRVLFGDADPGDLRQQPVLALRAFEQDGGRRILRSLRHAVARKGQKRAFRRARAAATA